MSSCRAELINGGGAVNVRRNKVGLHLALAQKQRQLARRGGLAGALKPGHENDSGRPALEGKIGVVSAEQGDQLVVHHLYHLLRGGDALHDFNAQGRLAHALGKFLDDPEIDVGLKQGEANLPQGVLNVRLGKLRTSAELAEYVGKSVCQAVKHSMSRYGLIQAR